MTPEKAIAIAVKDAGMTIAAVSRKTGIPYSKLQPSLSGNRELRADEYLALCSLFRLDPRIAADL